MSEVKKNKTKALIAASVAGIMTLAGVAIMSAPAQAAEGTKCYGVNACKGTGECGGVGHSCAGKNACQGMGWITTADEATCLGMEGGSLEPLE